MSASPELLRRTVDECNLALMEATEEQRSVQSFSGRAKGVLAAASSPQPRRFWVIFAALWLQAIVAGFVIVRFSRLQTPISDWVNKALELIR